jgi:hypothetical protein
VSGHRWAEDLPPVPDGHRVTVTFSTDLDAAHHGPALDLLGYQVVGVHPGPPGRCVADFLVSQPLLESHPTWWRSLAGLADRAFNLALGPVLSSLAPVLRRHLDARAEPRGPRGG